MAGLQEGRPAELSVLGLAESAAVGDAAGDEPDRRRCRVAPLPATACHVALVELSLDDDDRVGRPADSPAADEVVPKMRRTSGGDVAASPERNPEPCVGSTASSGASSAASVCSTGAQAVNEPSAERTAAEPALAGAGEPVPPHAPSVVDVTASGAAAVPASGAGVTGSAEAAGRLAELERQLSAAQHQLQLRDQQVAQLTGIRNQIEAEMEELTASLFQEAHKMVLAANEKQAGSERALQEANMKIDVLSAEVSALKALVITSTPSRPNAHLHPQLQSNGIKIFKKGHHRSPSNQELVRPDASPPSSPARSPPGSGSGSGAAAGPTVVACAAGAAAATQTAAAAADAAATASELIEEEVDPRLLADVAAWRQQPTLDVSAPFVAAVYRQEVLPCLQFATDQLSARVAAAALSSDICIEEVAPAVRAAAPAPPSEDSRRCALLHAPRSCRYRMKLPDQADWMDISQLCRNRITAVCDFFNYLRYVQRGLVKGSVVDVYRQLMRLRRTMALAKLGFTH